MLESRLRSTVDATTTSMESSVSRFYTKVNSQGVHVMQNDNTAQQSNHQSELGSTSGVSPPAALSIEDFCARYAIGRTTAYTELKAGRLRPTKVGRRTIIAVSDADAWLAAARDASEPARRAAA